MSSLQTLWDQCRSHDWFYHFSDDSRVYNAGSSAEAKLKSMAASLGEEGLAIFNQWKEHHFSGPAYKTEKVPAPERPDGES